MNCAGYLRGALASLLFTAVAGAVTNVQDLGIEGDGLSDQTSVVQTALDAGNLDLSFPPGDYRLGTLSLPKGTHLQFAAGAVWIPEPAKISNRRLLNLTGNNIYLEGLTVNFLKNGKDAINLDELEAVVVGEGLSDLHFSGFKLERTSPYETADPQNKGKSIRSSPTSISLKNCRNIEVDHCAIKNMYALLSARNCADVSVHENRAEGGRHITDFFDGSRSLRHYNNWSSGTKDQIRWWGGDSNDQKPDTRGSRAEVVREGVSSSDPKFNKNETGVYEILVQGNYAEYGETLGWGSKGRQIIFNANIAKYMSDMAYDSEGGENVIFSNNISINSRTAGIGCYFWSEKVVITGNQVLVQNEGDPKYQGDFIRLQSLWEHPRGKTGAGNVVITGNLFSSNLDKGLRYLKIESSRDLLITGNQFSNGGIQTKELACGPLSIQDNQFSIGSPGESPVILLREGVSEATLSGNILRRSPPEPATSEKRVQSPAIQIVSGGGQKKIMENNQVSGWTEALQITTVRRKNQEGGGPCRYLVRNNLFGGTLNFQGIGKPDIFVFGGNRDSETLQLLSAGVAP